MKNSIFLLLITFFLLQCKGDNPIREQAKAEAVQLAKQTVKETVEPVANPAPGFTQPTVNETLTLKLGSAKAETSEQTCLKVYADGFTDLIGLQFSIRWNPEELSFKAVENIKLEDLTLQNFGATHTELGVVVLSWIHQSLKGVTLSPDSELFDVCFTAKAGAGTDAEVRFEPRPTPYEVISSKEDLLRFSGVNGMIKIR